MKKEDMIVKPQEPRSRLSPAEVQQQQFRRSFRGYDEQEVDDFLDRVTEELSLPGDGPKFWLMRRDPS